MQCAYDGQPAVTAQRIGPVVQVVVNHIELVHVVPDGIQSHRPERVEILNWWLAVPQGLLNGGFQTCGRARVT